MRNNDRKCSFSRHSKILRVWGGCNMNFCEKIGNTGERGRFVGFYEISQDFLHFSKYNLTKLKKNI